MPVKNCVYQLCWCSVEDIKGFDNRIAWGRSRNNLILRHGWSVRYPKKKRSEEKKIPQNRELGVSSHRHSHISAHLDPALSLHNKQRKSTPPPGV
jgi:hypothetical protein